MYILNKAAVLGDLSAVFQKLFYNLLLFKVSLFYLFMGDYGCMYYDWQNCTQIFKIVTFRKSDCIFYKSNYKSKNSHMIIVRKMALFSHICFNSISTFKVNAKMYWVYNK